MLPRIDHVREMDRLLAIQQVGVNWVLPSFLKCHPKLQSKFSYKYDYQQAKYKDPILIQG
jgi:hypothetical protein